MGKPMIWLLALLLAVAAGAAGWWLYRGSFGGGEVLPGPLGSLQRHFEAQGLRLDAALVRHPQMNEVHKNSRFRTRDGRLFYVYWCRDAAAAQEALAILRAAPREGLVAAKAQLVIILTEWPAADPLAQQVLRAFETWPG